MSSGGLSPAEAMADVFADGSFRASVLSDRLASKKQSVQMQPEPLDVPELSANEYPVDALGEILGDAALALQDQIQVPAALCGQSLLAAASMMVQPFYDIKLPHGSIVPASLNMLTGLGSGDRKSATDGICLKPIRDLEHRLSDAYAEKIQTYDHEMEAFNVSCKAASADAKKAKSNRDVLAAALHAVSDEPEQPLSPYLLAEDPTVEGIYRSFRFGYPSQGCFTDEGAMIIGGHALNGDNFLKTAGRLSKIWDGSPFDRTRGGDERCKLFNRRLALHWLMQPDVLNQLMRMELLESQGFLPRFLLAVPDSLAGSRLYKICDPQEHPSIQQYYRQAEPLLDPDKWPIRDEHPQELNPSILKFTQEAIESYRTAFDYFEPLIGRFCELEHLKVFVSRTMEQAARIAGVLVGFEQGITATTIDENHIERGILIAQYSLAEWERVKHAAQVNTSLSNAKLLLAWAHETNREVLSRRLVSQYGPHSLRKKEPRDRAIELLASKGWFRPIPGGYEIDGNRCREAWEVIPCGN